MNVEENLNCEISRALGDKTFDTRIAGAVLRRASKRAAQRVTVCTFAALLAVTSGILWFYRAEAPAKGFAGLDRPASRAVVREVGNAWKDTDNIINASFGGR